MWNIFSVRTSESHFLAAGEAAVLLGFGLLWCIWRLLRDVWFWGCKHRHQTLPNAANMESISISKVLYQRLDWTRNVSTHQTTEKFHLTSSFLWMCSPPLWAAWSRSAERFSSPLHIQKHRFLLHLHEQPQTNIFNHTSSFSYITFYFSLSIKHVSPYETKILLL